MASPPSAGLESTTRSSMWPHHGHRLASPLPQDVVVRADATVEMLEPSTSPPGEVPAEVLEPCVPLGPDVGHPRHRPHHRARCEPIPAAPALRGGRDEPRLLKRLEVLRDR